MNNITLYLKWIAILCAGMGLFGVGVLVVGYKEVSFGLVATIVCLWLGSVALAIFVKKKGSRTLNK